MSSHLATPVDVAPLSLSARIGDYAQLTRPRIAVMVLVTTLLGALSAGSATLDAMTMVLTLVGTGLVSAGASIFNQLIERRQDARMERTENRPLPAGRLGAIEVTILGTLVTLVGMICLAVLPTGPAAAVITGATFVLYVFVYTPAKRHTWWNTFIGAVPGALPPLIGWSAATGSLSWAALPLFALLFFWQIPHFLAIAWMYRDDYRRAGLQMLPVLDPAGRRTLTQMLLHTVLLIAASLTPLAFGAGWGYAAGALALGITFLALVFRFGRDRSVAAARSVLRMSIVYLPVVLGWLALDRYW